MSWVLHVFYKINKFFIFNICFLYHFSCIDVRFYFLVHCIYSRFSKWRPSAILDFKILSIFVEKSNYRLFLRRHAKYGEDRTIRGRVLGIFDFKMAVVHHIGFHIFAIFVKNSNLRLFLRRQAKFGEDRTIRDRVIAYFRFSKWRTSAILDLV